jgi:plasmid stabilization system protein ParE
MRVTWTIPALDNLDEIQDFIAQRSPGAAYKLTAALVGRTDELLRSNPMIGRKGRIIGTRELVLPGTPYVVVYRLRNDVEILAVVHGARQWPTVFD